MLILAISEVSKGSLLEGSLGDLPQSKIFGIWASKRGSPQILEIKYLR